MITSIERLNFFCTECGQQAAFKVIRTNDDLPEPYFRHGTRMETYCRKHMPADAMQMWEEEKGR